MALIAHFPLTEDLNDISGNGNHAIPTGTAIFNDNGKIGKCLDCSSTQVYVPLNDNLKKIFSDTEFTISLWWYQTPGNSNWCDLIQYTDINGIDRRLELSSETTEPDYVGFWTNIGKGDITYTSNIYYTYNFGIAKNSWFHLTLRRTKTSFDVFRNGLLVSSKTPAGEEICEINSNLNLNRHTANNSKVNDMRFYDNALTDKEIYEISKAKILHYNFNDFQEPTTNLWKGSLITYNNYSVPASLTATGETFLGQPVYRLAMTVDTANSVRLSHFQTSLNSHGVYGSSMTYLANTKYSASIYWKAVNKTDVVFGGTASNIGGWTAQPNVQEGSWNRYTQTRSGTVTTDKTDNVFFSFYSPSLQLDETIYIDVCCPQIEQGKDYSTNYVNGSRTGSVTDISGFGNHATLSETYSPRWINRSKTGNGAYEFINKPLDGGVFQHIRTDKELYIPKQFTISAFIKGTTDNQPLDNIYPFGWKNLCTNGPTGGVNDNRSGIIYYYEGGAYTSWSPTGRNIYDGDWHHWAITYDGETGAIKQYVDGLKTDEGVKTNLYHLETFRYYYLGSAWSTSYGGHGGELNDAKVYATALSDADILKLYEERATLDDKGNLRVCEIDTYIEMTNDTNDTKIEINSCPWGLAEYPNGQNTYLKVNDIRVGGSSRGFCAFVLDRAFTPYEYAYFDTFLGTSNNKIYYADGTLKTDYGVQASRVDSEELLASYLESIPDGYLVCVANHDAGYCTDSDNLYNALVKYLQIETPKASLVYRVGWHVFAEKNGQKFDETYTGVSVAETYKTLYLKKKTNWIDEKGVLDISDFSEVGITEGLVGYYPLNDETEDYSGNNIHGINYGATKTDGLNQGAYLFDGTSNYIKIDGISEKIEGSSFSMSAFIKGSTQDHKGIVAINTSTGGNRALWLIRNAGMGLYDGTWDIGNIDVDDDQWHHVVVTYDFDSGNAKLYTDSVLDLEIAKNFNINSTDTVSIGMEYDGAASSDHFKGKIQNVKFFNRALTPEEIAIEHKFLMKPEDDKIIMTNNKIYIDCIKEGL